MSIRLPQFLLAAAALAVSTTAAAQLGLDLTPDEKAKAPAPAPARPGANTPAPVTMPELDLGARKGEGGKRIAAANALLAKGDVEPAALAYDAIVRDPALGDVYDEARYQLAKCLVRMKLPHAALAQLDPILSKGPQGSRYFYNGLEQLFEIGKQVNESVLVSQVARYAKDALPPASADRFNYLLARYSYERGHGLEELGRAADAKRAYEEARRLITMVRPEAGAKPPPTSEAGSVDAGDTYARSRFLDGLVQYGMGASQAAVESFKEVVRLTNPKRGRAPDPRVRELALLQLARIHYEYKQNRYAIFYYDRMPWGGESWLEGLWEASYAHYRIGNYEKALGNLLTLQSPYFRDAWFPESWILKAIIYYENCRYPEARAILDDFRNQFGGALSELDGVTKKGGTPASFYDVLQDAQKGRGAAASPALRRIVALALSDQNVRRLNDSIVEVEAEMDTGLTRRGEAFRASPLAKGLKDGLSAERKRLVDEAGARARAKLEYERDGLRDLLQSALRIKIEVSRKEREALEGALAKGGPVEVVRDYKYSTAVSDEHLYWQYDGEFWRDELGTFTYTLTKGCRDTSAR